LAKRSLILRTHSKSARARLASVRPMAGDADIYEYEGYQRGQVVNLNRALSGLPEMPLGRTNYTGILDRMCGQGGRIEERRREKSRSHEQSTSWWRRPDRKLMFCASTTMPIWWHSCSG
jgi:hypothetical protein